MSPLAALLILLVSATLQTASSIDVPVDTNFELTGLHSDFAQQYYVLNTELDDTAQLSDVSGDALPSALRQQLSSNSLSWGDLPGLLQRAFLWDAGYVLTPTHTLAKVYTRCGRSMAELVVPPKAFERAGCQLRECVLPDGMIFHRSLNCKALQLSRAVQCAVDAAEDMSAPAYAAVWGDGGEADTLPEVTVQRHVYVDTDGKPNLIFALHTTDFEVAYTQCPLTPAMVIPCAPYNLVNQSKFCSPEPGEVASAWLTKYAADHKQDKTWLLVPLCIVTFVTFGTVAVYRYKSALRDEARREVDLFMRENRHLFDNGVVEAFLVPKRKGKGRSRSSHRTGTGRQHRSSSYSSSSSLDSDGSAYSSRASIRDSETSLSYDEGIQNAAAFEHFDATIGLSASAFDPLASNTRINPLQSDTETPLQDVKSKDSTPDDATARKNEMAIRSFRLFESHRKIRRLRIPMGELQLLRPLSRGTTGEIWLALHSNTQVALKQLVPEKRRLLHEIEMFLAEIYLMAQLKHPHIVALNGIAWNTLEHVVMVQEYMEVAASSSIEIESANTLTELLTKADQTALVTVKVTTTRTSKPDAAAHNNRVSVHAKRSLKRGFGRVANSQYSLEGMDALYASFNFREFRSHKYGLFDFHIHFYRGYVEFNIQMADLEASLQLLIDVSFDSIRGIEQSLQLLKQFQQILQRETLRDLDSNFSVLRRRDCLAACSIVWRRSTNGDKH
ncbi:hypothetical protein PI124_g19558 [Phytophthora idaei]|nr:hypothetical protein PI124_g19558 [Phytophthora idaei]